MPSNAGKLSVSQVLALTHFPWYWSEVFNYIASMQVLLFLRIPILYSDNKTTDPPPAIWKVSWRTHGLSPESTESRKNPPLPELKLHEEFGSRKYSSFHPPPPTTHTHTNETSHEEFWHWIWVPKVSPSLPNWNFLWRTLAPWLHITTRASWTPVLGYLVFLSSRNRKSNVCVASVRLWVVTLYFPCTENKKGVSNVFLGHITCVSADGSWSRSAEFTFVILSVFYAGSITKLQIGPSKPEVACQCFLY